MLIEQDGKSYEIHFSDDDEAVFASGGFPGVVGKALATGEPYEAKLLYHIRRQGFTGTAIDVGAHIGNHTLWLAVMCGLHVIAFEPLEYRKLIRNLALNDLNGKRGIVSPQPVALGARAGHATLREKGTLVMDDDGAINVCRLDDFHFRDVALIKIDVEGMEPDVLHGASRTIEHERPVLYVEAQDEAAHHRLQHILEPLGYTHRNTFGATPLEEWAP